MAATPEEKLDNANVTRRSGTDGDLTHTVVSERWEGWFDGAASPNPGRIGLGGVLRAPNGEQQEWSLPTGRSGCNNEAELLAMIAVLERAHRAGVTELRLCGDSDFAIRAGRLCCQGGDPTGLTRIPRLLEMLDQLQEAVRHMPALELIWLPRHRNRDADRLSRQALGLPDKPAPVPGKGGASRKRAARRR